MNSGGYSANKDPDKRTKSEWEKYAKEYSQFAMANADRCTYVIEFDYLEMGQQWLDDMRRGVWRELGDKFLPTWSPLMGIAALEVTAERYGRVAVVGDVLTEPGQTAASQLIRLARRGIEVHGLAMTKMSVAENIPFTSVSSSSWTTPMRFGDVIVFDGRSLHRYPVKYAAQGRKRHKMWVAEQGFDGDAWVAGDRAEAIRVCIWSWLAWAQALSARHGTIAPAPVAPPGEAVPAPVGEVDNVIPMPPNTRPTSTAALSVVRASRKPAKPRELVDLPLFGFEASAKVGEDGSRELLPVLSDRSVRVCESCFLASECPAYEAGSACAYRFPLRVETKGQRRAVFNGAIEMQFQRVAFMRMSEELSGGYADPNLSQEIDRLIKMMVAQSEVEDTREYFSMTVQARTKPGVISRLLGVQVANAASQLERPLSESETDRVILGDVER